MKSQLTLNGVAIKRPSNFKIERYNITKSSRLASGKMSMELIAKKRKFFCTWDAIGSKDLNKILAQIWDSRSAFFKLTYVESNVTKSATVYAGAIPTELHRTDNAEWVWKNVQINFIEQ